MRVSDGYSGTGCPLYGPAARRSLPSCRRAAKQPVVPSTRARPSNQMSNNHHRQLWTPADIGGRYFPGQVRRSPCSPGKLFRPRPP
jgi:hypothetical protein